MFVRNSIDESLDPLLPNVGGWSDGGPVGTSDEAGLVMDDLGQ
jgi:hypothetical protein